MIEKIKKFVASIKLKYAIRWINGNGFSVVRIVEKAGTKYIVTNDGSFLRIGRRDT